MHPIVSPSPRPPGKSWSVSFSNSARHFNILSRNRCGFLMISSTFFPGNSDRRFDNDRSPLSRKFLVTALNMSLDMITSDVKIRRSHISKRGWPSWKVCVFDGQILLFRDNIDITHPLLVYDLFHIVRILPTESLVSKKRLVPTALRRPLDCSCLCLLRPCDTFCLFGRIFLVAPVALLVMSV